MKHAIAILTLHRDTNLHNAPIQENEGRHDEAALSRAVAADCSLALDQLNRWNGAPNDTTAAPGSVADMGRRPAAPAPTIGRTLHYMLSEADAKQILLQRGSSTARGGNHNAGDIVPLVVTRIWDTYGVNGQVILDGNDCLWVTSIQMQDEGMPHVPGRWNWPPRA